MKLSELETNVDAIEGGAWVGNIPDMAGLRLKVRGANNKDWRRLMSRLIEAVPRKKRMNGRMDPDEQDRINSILLLETGLLDWGGLEDDDDQPLPYSKEVAKGLLQNPKTGRFREAVMWACMMVGDHDAQAIEDAAKN